MWAPTFKVSTFNSSMHNNKAKNKMCGCNYPFYCTSVHVVCFVPLISVCGVTVSLSVILPAQFSLCYSN